MCHTDTLQATYHVTHPQGGILSYRAIHSLVSVFYFLASSVPQDFLFICNKAVLCKADTFQWRTVYSKSVGLSLLHSSHALKEPFKSC